MRRKVLLGSIAVHAALGAALLGAYHARSRPAPPAPPRGPMTIDIELVEPAPKPTPAPAAAPGGGSADAAAPVTAPPASALPPAAPAPPPARRRVDGPRDSFLIER